MTRQLFDPASVPDCPTCGARLTEHRSSYEQTYHDEFRTVHEVPLYQYECEKCGVVTPWRTYRHAAEKEVAAWTRWQGATLAVIMALPEPDESEWQSRPGAGSGAASDHGPATAGTAAL